VRKVEGGGVTNRESMILILKLLRIGENQSALVVLPLI